MPIIEEGGYSLWDVEYVKEGPDFILRVYADKEGGIGIDDCVAISRKLSDKLDEADMIEEAYILEVSSPGLTRPLKKDKDFERSIGRLVDVKLYGAVNGMKELEGELKAFDEGSVTVTIDEEEIKLERSNISGIRLAFVE
ncbi:MAG: ribosome maturation factor RimP [Eubacterium sp.]|nr:ribosome maturation factor RimP [Eubacterium sp.]